MNNETTLTDLVDQIETMPTRKRLVYTAVGWAFIGCAVYAAVKVTSKVVEALAENSDALIDI